MSSRILYLLCAILVFVCVGCTAVGVAAYKVMGPPDVPAKYAPPEGSSVVVLVEDYHRSTALTDDEMVSRYTEEALKGNLKKVTVIDSSKIRDMALNEPAQFKAMSVAEIGRSVGAEKVIWVEVDDRNIESLLGGEQLRGDVSARVKMVDSKTAETVWPTEMQGGYPVDAGMKWGSSSVPTEAELKQKMYRELGDKIAKLFYKWKPDYDEPEGFIEK